MFAVQQPAVTSSVQAMERGTCTGSQQGSEVFVGKGTAFSTTETFTTTRGFVISTPQTSCLPPAAAGQSSSRSSSSCSDRSSSSRGSAAEANNRQQPVVVDKPSTPVGWSGLLEISRSAGCPGLMGGAAGSCEQEAAIEVSCTAHASTGVRRLVKSVVRGIKARQDPEAAREGMGGTYFFTNEAGRKVAIFKPCDEEPLAPANPKGYVGRNLGDPGWKSTVRVGEAAMREVAAYLLDHDHYAQVPHTVLVRARHPAFNYKYAPVTTGGAGGGLDARAGSVSSMVSVTTADTPAVPRDSNSSGISADGVDQLLKLGSLQEFVYHIADTSDFGASRFRTRDVHAIGILDIRLFNTDRHAGNILVRQPQLTGSCRDLSAAFTSGSRTLGTRPPSIISPAAAAVSAGEYELIPIDHGFCLPEALEAPYFEWLHWPQACLPFSDEELGYIARLDAAADIALLQQELPNLRPECLRVLEVSTNFLQRCAAAGLSLADIGALASRPLDALDGDDSNPSELEKACIAARQAVETRELAANSMLSSSYSSDGFPTAVLEEDEEDLLDCSTDCGDTVSEQGGQGGGQRSMPDSPMSGLQQQQPSQLLKPPSRLGVMAAAAPAAAVGDGSGMEPEQPQQQVLVSASKVPSGDMGASVASESTACGGLATAMSLGRPGVDGDLLFDLDDDSSHSNGSSAAHTPVANQARSGARGSSPLGRRLAPPAAAAADGGGDEAAAAAAEGEDRDVVMAAAGSLRDAEVLSEYLNASMQLQPSPPTSSAFSGLAAAAVAGGDDSNSGGARNTAAAAAAPSGSGSLSSPLVHALSTPVSGTPVNVARSMQVGGGEGWMFKAKASATSTVGRCMNVKTKTATAAARRRTGVSRTMYPPPVIRAPPRSTNEVLSGLNEQQWQAFMAELLAYMDDALRPGRGAWRGASQAAGLGTVAMSCPRF